MTITARDSTTFPLMSLFRRSSLTHRAPVHIAPPQRDRSESHLLSAPPRRKPAFPKTSERSQILRPTSYPRNRRSAFDLATSPMGKFMVMLANCSPSLNKSLMLKSYVTDLRTSANPLLRTINPSASGIVDAACRVARDYSSHHCMPRSAPAQLQRIANPMALLLVIALPRRLSRTGYAWQQGQSSA